VPLYSEEIRERREALTLVLHLLVGNARVAFLLCIV